MADTKLTALAELTTAASTDILYIVSDPAGTPASKKITKSNLLNELTLAKQTVGFTIAGGTTSKTLTVPLNATVSGTNTGDQTSVSGNAGTATLAASTSALKSATTTVDVAAATAPTTGQVLTATGSTTATWQTPSSGFSDPMTTRGDIIVRNTSNVTARLGIGTTGKILTSDGTDISWQSPATAGTVTAVSVATANGVSGSSSGGATPALTIALGAITPSSVNSVVLSGSATPTLAVTGTTTVSGANTGDQTNVSGSSGSCTGNAATATLATATNALKSATTTIDVVTAAAPSAGQVLKATGGTAATWQTLDYGNVFGPASSTDNALVRFDLATGKLLQDGTVTQTDTGSLQNINEIKVALSPSATSYAEGQMRWNTTEHTLDIETGVGGSTLQVGQELYVHCRNNTGASIANGSVVYISGATAGYPTIAKAIATSVNCLKTLGVTTSTIADGANGFITTFGDVHDLDTSSYTAGDILYVSPTTAGLLTKTKPTVAGQYAVEIGCVHVIDASVGVIHITVDKHTCAKSISISSDTTVVDTANMEDAIRHIWSTGLTDGGAISLGVGTIDIAANDFVTRQGTTEDANLNVYRDAGTTALAIAANDVSYVYRDYNSGTPTWATSLVLSGFNGIDKVITYAVARNGTRTNYLDARGINVDVGRKNRHKDVEWDGYVYNGFWRSILANSLVTSSGLNLLVTNGKYFWFDNSHTHTAFDTTVAGAADANNWIRFYNRTGTWTQVTGQKSIEAVQYDNAGTLTNMSNNNWRADWVYVVLDDGGVPYLATILGNAQYSTQALATDSPQPTILPPQINGIAVLLAQVVIQKNAATVTVRNAGTTSFSGSAIAIASSFSDATFNIFDDADSTKIMNMQLSGITTATTRTVTMPDASGTMTLLGNTSTGSGSVVLATTPTLVTPVLGVATATSINKVALTTPATSATLTLVDGTTLTGPAASGTAMTLGNAETVAGVKTFNDGSIKINGATSGATTLKAAAVASTYVATLPAATDTLVGLATADILTNKTLTSPKIGTAILDTNGNELVIVTATGSAVNEITIANGATGANATITASGETNTGITITGKGTKGVAIGNRLVQKEVAVSDGAGAVIDCSLGNVFTWVAAADRTAGTPTNPPSAGQVQYITIEFTASGAARTLTLPTATTNDFAFGSDITALTQTASGKKDRIGCKYDHVSSRWHVIAYVKGY